MKDRGLRIVRGWIGALICTCLAAASHSVIDGAMPPLPVLGLLLCISAVICTAFASTGISLLRTGLAVLLSQGIYHGAFGLFGHQHQVSGIVSATGAMPGHEGHVMSLGIDPAAAAAAADPATGLLMPLSHVLAAVLTVLAMRRGELAVRALAEAIFLYVPRLILFVRSLQGACRRRSLLGVAYRAPLLRNVLRPVLHRRGPPRGTAFALS